MWHKAVSMGHIYEDLVNYKAFCLDVTQGRINGAYLLGFSKLESFLFRCDTRPYQWSILTKIQYFTEIFG